MESENGARSDNLEDAYSFLTGRDEKLASKRQHLESELFADFTNSRKYSFMQAARILEQYYYRQPSGSLRADRHRNYKDEEYQFVQPAKNGHIPSSVGDFKHADGLKRLECNFFGFYGASGPMPVHITQLVREHESLLRSEGSADKGALVDFLNIFNHLLLDAFYRVNKLGEPTFTHYEEDGIFSNVMDGIGGNINISNPATLAGRRALAVRYSGGKPTREGLMDVLNSRFTLSTNMSHAGSQSSGQDDIASVSNHIQCGIEENRPEWLQLSDELKLSFTASSRTLGDGCYLGDRVMSCQSRFAVSLTTHSSDMFKGFLPEGKVRSELCELILEYVGWEYVVDFWLTLSWAAILQFQSSGQMVLGGQCQLGRQVWLGVNSANPNSKQNTIKMNLLNS